MRTRFRQSLLLACGVAVLAGAPTADAAVVINLFRTGTMSSNVVAAPGQVVSFDARIYSPNGDTLGSYLTNFNVTSSGTSVFSFPVPQPSDGYEANPSYVFPGAVPLEGFAGNTAFFTAVALAPVPLPTTAAASLLLARMDVQVGNQAVAGDTGTLTLSPTSSFQTGGIPPMALAFSSTPAVITVVPEPSSVLLAGLLLGGFGIHYLRRRRQPKQATVTA